MNSNKENASSDFIFTASYIDQARLIDLYSLLNKGYSEYEEIRIDSSEEKRKSVRGTGDISSGFKLFKLGASAALDAGSGFSKSECSSIKRVQTVPSMLRLVVEQLKEKNLIVDMTNADEGSMVLIEIHPFINSYSGFMEEARQLIELGEEMKNIDKSASSKKVKSSLLSNIERLAKISKKLFNAEELVSIEDDYAVFGNVVEDNLYQSMRNDITGIGQHCLAQVRKIYPEGTQLMRNTHFSKFGDREAKRDLLDSVRQVVDTGVFNLDSQVVAEISDRPVYQLNLIALFQLVRPAAEA